MRDVEHGIAVDHLDAAFGEGYPAVGVLFLAIAARRVKHDANVDATLASIDDRLQKRGVGEDEHFDANGLLRAGDCVENWLAGVVG